MEFFTQGFWIGATLYSIFVPFQVETPWFWLGFSSFIAAASWLFLLISVIRFFPQLYQAQKEERYCYKKYDNADRKYINRTPRWIGIPKS